MVPKPPITFEKENNVEVKTKLENNTESNCIEEAIEFDILLHEDEVVGEARAAGWTL